MKIATYNIWDSDINFELRKDLLIQEIKKYKIDIIAFQEVRSEKLLFEIMESTGYQYSYYFDGLGFLSKYELKIIETFLHNNSYMLRAELGEIGFTNVHLDWETASSRKQAIDEYYNMLEDRFLGVEFLLGDFNEDSDEKLHYELIQNDFVDIHQTFAHSNGDYPKPTLDIINNPRWRKIKTDEKPKRFDWILMNTEHSFTLGDAILIGVDEVNEVTPSDHYGLLITLDLRIE